MKWAREMGDNDRSKMKPTKEGQSELAGLILLSKNVHKQVDQQTC